MWTVHLSYVVAMRPMLPPKADVELSDGFLAGKCKNYKTKKTTFPSQNVNT